MRILNLGVPRTASRYVAEALRPNAGHGHYQVADGECVNLSDGSHVDVAGLYVVAFVRNPFDLLVSHYAILREPDYAQHPDRPLAGLHFRDYLTLMVHRYATPTGVFPGPGRLFGQLYDGDRLVPDYIGRYETLDADLRRIAEVAGVTYTRGEPVNAARRGPYRDFYDEPMIRQVEQRYADDLAAFGYSFDGMRPVATIGEQT